MEYKIGLIGLVMLFSVAGIVAEKDWWETAQFYQIYPRSFMDSDGDGIGDLNGVTSRLEYLQEIGVTAFWLSPIFASPMADFGYDISDFFAIQPEYGTMDDFIALVTKAKSLNLKVILDFVPNHSSDENQWFINSRNRVAGYEDFYIWHSGMTNPYNTSDPYPPSNWISSFRDSAWQWDTVRQQFYYHNFLVKQPDLNYRNPAVVTMMKSVLTFWLDLGVDGFRIDAVPSLFEVEADINGNYPDEPRSYVSNDTANWDYLKHIYTTDQPETIDMVYQWRALMDEYQTQNGTETKVIMAETYSPIEIVMQYYGNATVEGAHMPFNFQIITKLTNTSTAYDFKEVIDNWMDNLPANKTSNWVMGNHDRNRVASRYGTNRIDSMNMILLTLPGASVNYNGEEIGMEDLYISWNDTVDPSACNSDPTIYEQFSRDPERTPFQWDNTTSAGFSNSTSTWLPVNSNYPELNVALQNATTKSHLHVFEDLVELRQTETLINGSLTTVAIDDDVFVVIRSLDGASTYLTVTNFGSSNKTFDFSNYTSAATYYYQVVSVASAREIGASVATSSISLTGYESFVLKSSAMSWLQSGDKRMYLLGIIFLFSQLLS